MAHLASSTCAKNESKTPTHQPLLWQTNGSRQGVEWTYSMQLDPVQARQWDKTRGVSRTRSIFGPNAHYDFPCKGLICDSINWGIFPSQRNTAVGVWVDLEVFSTARALSGACTLKSRVCWILSLLNKFSNWVDFKSHRFIRTSANLWQCSERNERIRQSRCCFELERGILQVTKPHLFLLTFSTLPVLIFVF